MVSMARGERVGPCGGEDKGTTGAVTAVPKIFGLCDFPFRLDCCSTSGSASLIVSVTTAPSVSAVRDAMRSLVSLVQTTVARGSQ